MAYAHRISLAFLVLGVLMAPLSTAADSPRIVFDVQDTTASPGESAAWLDLYLSNYVDTIAGLEFRLSVDRPDLVWFDLSGPDFDTAGALLSGFELVLARDSADHSIYRLIALANLPFSGPETPGIPAQNGAVLARLPFSTAAQPDTTGGLTCNITVTGPYTFSDPRGNSIGMVVVDTVPDTLFYRCTAWDGDICLGWVQIDPDTADWDSIYVYDIYVHEMDTTLVVMGPGSIKLVLPEPLMCDFNGDGAYGIGDLTCLTNLLFRGGSCPSVRCDCDGSGNDPAQPTIGDLTCMVAFLFRGGPPPAD